MGDPPPVAAHGPEIHLILHAAWAADRLIIWGEGRTDPSRPTQAAQAALAAAAPAVPPPREDGPTEPEATP